MLRFLAAISCVKQEILTSELQVSLQLVRMAGVERDIRLHRRVCAVTGVRLILVWVPGGSAGRGAPMQPLLRRHLGEFSPGITRPVGRSKYFNFHWEATLLSPQGAGLPRFIRPPDVQPLIRVAIAPREGADCLPAGPCTCPGVSSVPLMSLPSEDGSFPC